MSVNYLNEGILDTALMEKAVLFCLVLSRCSEAVTQSGLVQLDLGVLKVLLQVGLLPAVGRVVSG